MSGLPPVRSRRPDRRGGRRRRSHLDHDGRPLLPTAAPDRAARRSRSTCDPPSCSPHPACRMRRPSRAPCDKLRDALGPETLGDDDADRDRGGRAPRRAPRDRFARAALDHERITIEYFAHSTGEWSTREVEPEEVFVALGHWYVAAWDVRCGRRAAVPRRSHPRRRADTGERFEPRGLAGRGPVALHADGGRRPRPAPARSRRHDGSPSTTRPPTDEHDDGSLEVTLPRRGSDGSPAAAARGRRREVRRRRSMRPRLASRELTVADAPSRGPPLDRTGAVTESPLG